MVVVGRLARVNTSIDIAMQWNLICNSLFIPSHNVFFFIINQESVIETENTIDREWCQLMKIKGG